MKRQALTVAAILAAAGMSGAVVQVDGAREARPDRSRGAQDPAKQPNPVPSQRSMAERLSWDRRRHTRRRYPRRVPSWTTASYKRAQAKKRRVKAARRGGR